MRPGTVALLVLAVMLAAGAGSGAALQPGHLPADTNADAPETARRWVWSGDAGDPAGVLLDLQRLGVPAHLMPRLGMVSFIADDGTAHALAARHGGRVDAAQSMPFHLDRSVAYVEGDVVREAVGPVRDGPSVLVVDTGVDGNHPDFRSSLAANVRPQLQGGLVVGSLDQVPVIDAAGHGTHVASIVAGSGRGSSDQATGRYQGMFSLGRVVSYQVTLGEQEGEPEVDTLAALEAFEWALANQERYGIAVVTNSWGASGDFDPGHPVNQATLRMYKAGLVVVFSAGNEGSDGPGSLNKYCQAPWVLCVAAGDLQGARASFSSYGVRDPSRPYSHPDLTAPGVAITAAASLGSTRSVDVTRLSEGLLYRERSGTSMAAPHVAGAAALLIAANPSLGPDQVMDALVATTDPMADETPRVGSGYLNVREAFNLARQTVGNRPEFLAGQAVKYAGIQSGDPGYAQDPVTVGYDSARQAAPLLAGAPEPLWVLASPVAWVLLAAAAIAAGLGVSWRSADRPAPPIPARRAPSR